MSLYAILGIMAAVNSPLLLLLGKLIFKDFEGFFDCVIFWFKPDLWSFLDGALTEDWWETLKLWIFLAGCAAIIGAEYAIMNYCFPNIFPALFS